MACFESTITYECERGITREEKLQIDAETLQDAALLLVQYLKDNIHKRIINVTIPTPKAEF